MATYTDQEHKRAYELWESGYNLSQIAKIEGMPDRRTLRSWQSKAFQCICGYHGWADLRMKRLEGEQKLTGRDNDAAIDDLKEYSKRDQCPGDAEEAELSKDVLNALSRRFGKNIENMLTGDMDADLVSTAYVLLNKVRISMPDIRIRDPYQVTQLLRVAFAMLNAVRPQLAVEEEAQEIKITMPEYKRDKAYGLDEDDDEEN